MLAQDKSRTGTSKLGILVRPHRGYNPTALTKNNTVNRIPYTVSYGVYYQINLNLSNNQFVVSSPSTSLSQHSLPVVRRFHFRYMKQTLSLQSFKLPRYHQDGHRYRFL